MSGVPLTVGRIAASLAAPEPTLGPRGERAALALLLNDPGDEEPRLLPIERARQEGDPAAGQRAPPPRGEPCPSSP